MQKHSKITNRAFKKIQKADKDQNDEANPT